MEGVKEKAIDTDLITLTRHIIQQQHLNKQATGNFTILMNAITTACKFISSHVRKAGISKLLGLSGDVNSTGDICKKLDILANDVFINSLKNSGRVCVMVSEENDEYIEVECDQGTYFVAFDPLDGSSNIDANVSIGTIWSIFRRHSAPGTTVTKQDIYQNEVVSAGYCCYGSSTQIVYCVGQEVNGFTLDPSFGEFILTHPHLQLPSRGKIYSINEGYSQYWDNAIKEYVHSKKYTDKPYSHRYVGSMVADVHRTLLYGGIFLYPGDSRNAAGKLRVLYESIPMAYIMEKAGGAASTGMQRILDILPTHIHQKCPVVMGSKLDVEDLLALYQKHKDKLYG